MAVTVVAAALLSPLAARAQRPNQPGNPNQRNNTDQGRNDKKEPELPPLPSDKRLLAIHLKFVKEAETLAMEYERDKDWDKAKDAYREILKLVPQYTAARSKLEAILQREATANSAQFSVQADAGWQDTGIRVIAGKPVAIRATGTWIFTLTAELGPDGMQVPKELREYNLGSLVGVVDTGEPQESKPFVIGAEHEFVPEKSGKLFVSMYDNNPKDNKGFLKMEFLGTFDKK